MPTPGLQAAVVAQTTLASNIQGLVNGTLSTSQFQTAASVSALQSDVSTALLGSPAPTATPTPAEKSDAVALGVGLGIGLGVPLIGGAVFAYWYFAVRGARAATRGLAQPMI